MHEVGDRKYTKEGEEDQEVQKAVDFLSSHGCPSDVIEDIFTIVDNVSFSKELAGNQVFPQRLEKELFIVQGNISTLHFGLNC